MEIDFPPINNRIYKKRNEYYPHRYDDAYQCWKWHPRKANYWAKQPNKQIVSNQVRAYRTWKHNRKTQWKSE